MSSAKMLSAGVFLFHFTSKWHHIQQEKEGQCASQKTSSCETLPATTDMHIHTHTCAHTHAHMHMHTQIGKTTQQLQESQFTMEAST